MKLKKILSVSLGLILTIGAIGCTKNKEDDKTITVGASPTPHSLILDKVKPILEKEGYKLEIKVMDDYILPNTGLSEGSLDANYFQHVPYLEETVAEKNLKLTSKAKIHLEPIGLYSKKLKSIKDIKDNAVIAIPNDVTNGARALKLLADNGIINIKNGEKITPKDIISNPKNIKIKELNAEMIASVLPDVDCAIINTNFALSAKLNPNKDAIALESKDSPYSNILAVRDDNKDSDKIKALTKALTSKEIKKYIEEKFDGSIIPSF